LPMPAPSAKAEPEVSKSELSGRLRELFSVTLLDELARARGYRERLLTVEVLLLCLLEFIVEKVGVLAAIVDRLRRGSIPGLPALEVSPAAFYKRLRTISHTTFQELLRGVTRELSKSQKHVRKWVKDSALFASGVYALDDTTLDALLRKTPSLKKHPKGAMETLGGRLGCALDLVTGKFAEVLYDPDSKANEKTHARPLIERLPEGALYVFDLGYFAFPFLDYLSERGRYFVTRMREKTSYEVVRELATGPFYRDSIIWLGKHRADRAAYPVRLVELLIDGTWYRYLTNILDPRQLGALHVWALYGQRWTIEMSFAAIKRCLGLAYLRLTHQNGILTQIWCTLAVYQVLQDLRLDIAASNGWKEDEVSWERLTRHIGIYVRRPSSDQRSLREWLVQDAPRMIIRKCGCRHRRRTALPDEVAAACDPPPAGPDLPPIPPRQARQGDRRRSRKEAQNLIIAALS
jgi:hypothetical protein